MDRESLVHRTESLRLFEEKLPYRTIVRNPETKSSDKISLEYWNNMMDLSKLIDSDTPNSVRDYDTFCLFMKNAT